MEYNWSLFNNSNGSSHAWDFCSKPNSPYPAPALPYPPPPSSAGAFHALMLPDQDKSGTSSSLHNSIPADPHLTFLKLGKRHYFEDATPPVAKKGKCEGEGIPRCQVEGCEAALLKAKEYHRRHKVCEMHAKAPTVLLHGTHQRFCQQCSRFHGVAEFDEAKRSCRRRLAGHNERRRKSCQEHNSLARKHHSQQEMKMVVGVRRDEVGNNSEEYCALSLLSSTSPWNHHSHAHLPAAALRELIAQNRASLSASDCTPPTGGHLTLDLLQAQAQAQAQTQAQAPFALFSLHHHKSSKPDHGDHDSSQHWNLPLGY